jgi:endonuclease YncB( thermonuclease family)
VVLQRYVGDYGTEWGHFAAGSILVSLPVMLLFFALQRHFVEGLTAGGGEGDEVPIVASDRCASSREASVACVIDGDSFDVGACGDAGEHVRLVGVDAPDLALDPDPAECWADNAAAELRRRIEGRRVLLTFDRTCADADGTSLAWVWLEAGTDQVDDIDITLVESVNVQMVADGHARVATEEFGDVVYQADLTQAVQVAEVLGRGLWGVCASGS